MVPMFRQKSIKNCSSCHSDRSNCKILLLQIKFYFYFNVFAFLYSGYFQLKQARQDSLPILNHIIKEPENKRCVIFPPCENLSLLNIPLSLLAPCCCSVYIFIHKTVYITVSNKWGCFVGWAFLDFYKGHVRGEFSSHTLELYPRVFSFIFNIKSRVLEVEHTVLHWTQINSISSPWILEITFGMFFLIEHFRVPG